MKTLLGILSLVVLSSCAKQYLYRFPNEQESKRYKAEALRWSYKGTVPDTITVTDGDHFYRLQVTEKTKLEVYTTYGEKYRFTLRSIAVTGEGEFLGSNQMWRGYDQLSGAERDVMVREISKVVVVSDTPAKLRIVE